MLCQFLVVSCLAFADPVNGTLPDCTDQTRVSERDLTRALATKISASWKNVELRMIVDRLAGEHQTAVLLDRTIDPNQELDLNLGYQTLRDGFDVVAKTVSADICQLGNVIYIGPAKRVAQLRTLEHLREQEWLAIKDKLPAGKVSTLSRRDTVRWDNLDQPRQLVADLAARADVKVANPESIPHDLWACGTLPKTNLTEALSLFLIQFDQTFHWNADATEIRLVPIPKTVAVEKSYSPAGGPPKRASQTIRERFLESAAKTYREQYPGMTSRVDVEHHKVFLSGTIEQHEAVAGLDKAKPAAKTGDAPPPIRKRQFTLRIERVPASALMKKLEESGIQFAYDKAQFAAKKIDLNSPISIDVDMADADAFFEALCDPLKLKFSIDNLTVTLTPK